MGCRSARRINVQRSRRITSRRPGRTCSARPPYSPSALLFRHDQYNYYGSDNPYADFTPDLQTNTVDQERTLTNVGARASLSYVKGIHNIKGGVIFEDTILNENDRFGIVDPTENAPFV